MTRELPLEIIKIVILIASILVKFNRCDNAVILIFPDGKVRNITHDRRSIHMLDDKLHNRIVRSTGRVRSSKNDRFFAKPVILLRLDFCNARGVDSYIDVLCASSFPADFFFLVIRVADKVIQVDGLESLAFES